MNRMVLLAFTFAISFVVFRWASARLIAPMDSQYLFTLDLERDVHCVAISGVPVLEVSIKDLKEEPLTLTVRGEFLADSESVPGTLSADLAFGSQAGQKVLRQGQLHLAWDRYYIDVSEIGSLTSQIKFIVASDGLHYTHESIVDGALLLAKISDGGKVDIFVPATSAVKGFLQSDGESNAESFATFAVSHFLKDQLTVFSPLDTDSKTCHIRPLSTVINEKYLQPNGILNALFNNVPDNFTF